jgi:GAF domain-containing protein
MTTIEAHSSQQNRVAGLGFLGLRTIRGKLLVIFIALGLLILIAIVGLSFFTAQRILQTRAFAELEGLRETRNDQLLLWFSDRRRDVKVFSANPTTVLAADALDLAVQTSNSLGQTYAERLQAVGDTYRNQPDLANAGDLSTYSVVHERFHPFFQDIAQTYGYTDIYLVAPEGNIVYSIKKEADFGTNLMLGPYAVSNLETAFQQALVADDPNFTGFTDFAFFEPSNAPAAFLSSPIFDDDELIGVLIFELRIDIMNTIMNQRTGLGETGETYVVGFDYLFRNDSRFLDQLGTDSTVVNPNFIVDTVASRSAFRGESSSQVIDNYRGEPVLSAWKPIVMQEELPGPGLGGVTWAIIADIGEAEALQPANDLLNAFLVVSAIAGVVILGAGFFVARQIATPIQRMTETTEQIAAGDLGQRVEVTSRDEIGILASTFNQMTAQLEEIVGSLEQRVAERTERLETVAVLGERLSAILDLDQLLLELVNLVKERFGYYHAHVYLIDDERQNLVMTAGVGEAGEQMKAKGHAIPLQAATSLVARSARTAQIVTVDNVREAPDWLPNPLLPDTYSEMAVPIVLNEQVVGVLDVQEDKIAGLDDSDAALLRSLANQVAIAIRNARLFRQVETALAEARAAQEKYIEQAWDRSKIRAQRAKHLHMRALAAAPLPEDMMVQARQLVKTQKGPAIVSIGADEAPSNSIVAPVTLSGQTIGVLHVHESDATAEDSSISPWTDEDLALIETVLDQVAQVAENIRLFDETRQQVRYEHLVGQVTEKLRQAPTLEILAKTAAEELGQALGVAHSLVKVGIIPEVQSASNGTSPEGSGGVEKR